MSDCEPSAEKTSLGDQASSSPPLPSGVSRLNLAFELRRGARLRVTVTAQPQGTVPAEGEQPLVVVAGETAPPGRQAQPTPLAVVIRPETALPTGAAAQPRGAAAAFSPAWQALRRALNALLAASRLPQRYDAAFALFALALIVYLATRLIGLTDFPIYFFTDEAIHTVTAEELVQNHFRDPDQGLLPVYFKNGNYWNLSASVYLQVIPYLLFGKSAYVTRATSALLTLLAAVGIGLALRDVFKSRYWWVGPLILAIAPAWFLHSRTAFETVEFVSFYGAMLYSYLMYRYRSPNYVVPTLLLAGLAFYAYSPGQVVIAVTGLGLLLSDIRYHVQTFAPLQVVRDAPGGRWRLACRQDSSWLTYLLLALATLVIVALPYLRFQIYFRSHNPDTAALEHLKNLASYWTDPHLTFSEKLRQYVSLYLYGLSPGYWYVPNQTDLPRHLMKGYGNLLMVTLPFAALGLSEALRNLRSAAHRAVLVTLLAAPAGAAIVGIGITRTLAFNIPAAILTALGVTAVLEWIHDPTGKLTALPQPKLSAWRGALAFILLTAALLAASRVKLWADRAVLLFIGLYLALSIFPLLQWLLLRARQAWLPSGLGWLRGRLTWTPLAVFALLTLMSLAMLRDALTNGPFWYDDYGMGGLQYGAQQVFRAVERYAAANPGKTIIFSPNWANGTDVVARFFLKDPGIIQMGSIEGHMVSRKPLDENTFFVMTPYELETAAASGKFTDIRVEDVLPCPNQKPCFYFIHLSYVANIDDILAAEAAERRVLKSGTVLINGQSVAVRFSDMDMGNIQTLFDGDLRTVGRTSEANPFVIVLTFPQPTTFKGMAVTIGSIEARITARFYPTPDEPPLEYVHQAKGDVMKPDISFDFPEAVTAQVVRLEILNPNEEEPAHIHVWEIVFK